VLQPPTWGSTHFSRLLRHAWATVGLNFATVYLKFYTCNTLQVASQGHEVRH